MLQELREKIGAFCTTVVVGESYRLIVFATWKFMWLVDDVDSVRVERIGSSGDQLLKNVRCVSL